jgi:hypothetical protein
MLFEKDLHIVSFNVPFPANYGGVIDVFYKIKALAEQGVRVHLHCYQYGREPSQVLEKLCHKVYYYKRKVYKDPFFTRMPYIVATRNSSEVFQNLMQDDYPILFEGLHCCYYLAHPAFHDRMKIVRMHNIEHVYYDSLAKIEKNIFKKYFFKAEADRLQQFEKVLVNANAIAAISPEDTRMLEKKYRNVFYLPVFHGNDRMLIQPGMGDFALYHGNLGVGENNEAALYLVKQVFDGLDYPLVIAGLNPSKELKKAVENMENVTLLNKVDTHDINQLIQQAQINVLPTFQNTGMKLKLINVLYQGRHVIVNDKMVNHTGLEHLCHLANSPSRMRDKIEQLASRQFKFEELERRQNYLQTRFNNAENAALLLDHIFSGKLV